MLKALCRLWRLGPRNEERDIINEARYEMEEMAGIGTDKWHDGYIDIKDNRITRIVHANRSPIKWYLENEA